jgi:hypothetical protein
VLFSAVSTDTNVHTTAYRRNRRLELDLDPCC